VAASSALAAVVSFSWAGRAGLGRCFRLAMTTVGGCNWWRDMDDTQEALGWFIWAWVGAGVLCSVASLIFG